MWFQKWLSIGLIGALLVITGCGGEKLNNPVENQPGNSVTDDEDQNTNNADQDEEDNQEQDGDNDQDEGDNNDGDSD